MLLYPKASAAEHAVGTILQGNRTPGDGWVKCDGASYLKASYPSYVTNCVDLHPLRFQKKERIFFTNTPNAQIKSVAINGDVIVMVGGTTQYHWRSTDGGDNWTEYSTNLPSSQDWRVVRYANSQFVAAAYGTTVVAYSSDGITWSSASALSASGNWEYLEWDGTQWILAATAGGTYFTSPDGSTWTQRSSLPGPNNTGIAIDLVNNELMIATDSNSPNIYHSTDGISWTLKESWTYMLRPYDVNQYVSNIMYFPSSDKWLMLLEDMYNYGQRNQAYESFDDGDNWSVVLVGQQWAEEMQFFSGGSLWDGDCWIWFDWGGSGYVRGYWMNELGGFNLFSGMGYLAPRRPAAMAAEFEKFLICVDYDQSETTYEYVQKYHYGDYDASTYFCVPNLAARQQTGMESYIKIL